MLPDFKALFDRERELATLRRAWHAVESGDAHLVVLYGRRQVGKTFLVQHFLRGLPKPSRSVYMAATQESGEASQLQRLRVALSNLDDEDTLPDRFPTWHDALTDLLRLAEGKPLAVVLDEVPYLMRSTPGFGSILQAVWDQVRMRARPPRLLLVLTGSALSSMRELLGGSGPLYQRANLELHLEPFDLPTAGRMLGGSPDTVIEAYAACGGYPGHLGHWDPGRTAEENLADLAFEPYAVLALSGLRLIADAPAEEGYRKALTAIGRGLTRNAEIANEAGQRIEGPLTALERSGLIRRSVPIGRPGYSKRPRYEIPDPFLRFWFQLVHPDQQLIDTGLGQAVLARRGEQWTRHLAWVFEEEARRHAARLVLGGELPPDLLTGRWWSTGKQQREIDVLGLRGNRTALVGEVKWRSRPLDALHLRELEALARGAPDPLPDPLLAFWARRGARREVARAARVFTPEDMLTA